MVLVEWRARRRLGTHLSSVASSAPVPPRAFTTDASSLWLLARLPCRFARTLSQNGRLPGRSPDPFHSILFRARRRCPTRNVRVPRLHPSLARRSSSACPSILFRFAEQTA